MSTAPTITVAGNNVLPYLQERSMSVKLGSVDFTLVDQAYTPDLGDAVAMTYPTWAGTVVSVESTGYKGNVPFVKVRATNGTALPDPGAAPFNLSDTPNLSTTYGFRDLVVMRTVSDSGTDQLRAKCKVFQEGLTVGMEIDLTSVVEGFTADTFTIMELTTEWPVKDGATYTLDLGFGDNATAKAGKLYPITLKDEINKAANREITVENGGLVISVLLEPVWQYAVTENGGDVSAWALDMNGMVYTCLSVNHGWPTTTCGVGVGGWSVPARKYLAMCVPTPPDSDYALIRVVYSISPIGHGPVGAFGGTVEARHGPILLSGPLDGTYPDVSDINAETGTAASGGVLAVLDADTSSGGTIDIPAARIVWDDGFHAILAPMWFIPDVFTCHEDLINGGSVDDGGLAFSVDIYGIHAYQIAPGAFGWIETAPFGDYDGVDQTYTLQGGYSTVSHVWRNGIVVHGSEWNATDGTTLTMVNWAPLATDSIIVRYYIPAT